MQQDRMSVSIPTSLYQRVETLLDALGHSTVDAFVVHVVRSELAKFEAASHLKPEDEPQIVERLRRLGYID